MRNILKADAFILKSVMAQYRGWSVVSQPVPPQAVLPQRRINFIGIAPYHKFTQGTLHVEQDQTALSKPTVPTESRH